MQDVERINYSIKEAAQASGLSTSKLYKLSAQRAMPIRKIGSRVLIPRREFEAWLKSFEVEVIKK